MSNNIANGQEVQKNNKRVDIQDEVENNDLRHVMGTRQGRRFVYKIMMRYCGFITSSYDASGSRVYFNEGQRSIGLRLFTDIDVACPERFIEMITESKQKGENNV